MRGLLCSVVLGLGALAAQQSPAVDRQIDRQVDHGRIERHGDLRVVRLWGTPSERGKAHGELLAADIARLMRAEFGARFGRKPGMLKLARQALPRLIEFPEDCLAELEAMYAALEASGVDRHVEALDRAFDQDDLLIANALDVFGLMGCSGFTVTGDEVDGGGVLTGRNFDWPFTGPHMVDDVVLLVQHPADGAAVASVTWPGYTAVVTGVSSEGVAAFLHVGSARITMTPEPSSWPTGLALRAILMEARAADPAAVFEVALERLGYTSPPVGYLSRVVLPAVPADGSPVGVFEADSRSVERALLEGSTVVTNHFQGRRDGRAPSKDSTDRWARVHECIGECLRGGDHKVSVEEAWGFLESVQRGGKHGFGTLHSLIFRAEPWCFELRVGQFDPARGLVAAPAAGRRYALAREEVFPAVPPAREGD